MNDLEQVRSYVAAYAWGGPTTALQLHHLRELSLLIRPGDTVVDLACGPGPLLLELAAIYPDTKFIGADLSPTMLKFLEDEAAVRGLGNISVMLEDIRNLPSLGTAEVDLVISTSALHHVPDEASLQKVFQRIGTLLRPDGGFYLFDFGLLKSSRAREMFVNEVAKTAPPLTARDYDHSLRAAFPIDLVFALAEEELPRPFISAKSALMDFCYFLQTPPRAVRSETADAHLRQLWHSVSFPMRAEHLLLRHFRCSRLCR